MRLSKFTAVCLLCVLLVCVLLSGCTEEPIMPVTTPTDTVTEPDASVIGKDVYNGSDMEEFTLDEVVKRIEEGAFANCRNLQRFHCASKEVSIHENAFSGSENVVFYCYLDSTVDMFAREHGYERVYYDAFSVQCDTVNNGCVGLPITWTAVDVMPGQEIESEFVYTVYMNDQPVFTSEPTVENRFSYTPAEGGLCAVTVQISNDLTQSSVTCEAVPVANQLFMGYYEQDNDPTAMEPILWRILTVEDGKAFVISEKVLDRGSYFNPEWIKFKYTYWSHSCIAATKSINYWGSLPVSPSRMMADLTAESVPLEWYGERGPETDLFYLHARYWCNQVFYNDAFSDEERERILLSNLVNHDNAVYGTIGGPDTQDYVFFMSKDELDAYLPTNEDRKASFTTYADNLPVEYGGRDVYYWLRTPGVYRCNAMFVYGEFGAADPYGSDVGHNMVGYRPAMWIQIGG